MLSPPTWARGIDEDILAEGSPAEEAAAADAAAASLAAAARETAAVLEARLAGQETALLRRHAMEMKGVYDELQEAYLARGGMLGVDVKRDAQRNWMSRYVKECMSKRDFLRAADVRRSVEALADAQRAADATAAVISAPAAGFAVGSALARHRTELEELRQRAEGERLELRRAATARETAARHDARMAIKRRVAARALAARQGAPMGSQPAAHAHAAAAPRPSSAAARPSGTAANLEGAFDAAAVDTDASLVSPNSAVSAFARAAKEIEATRREQPSDATADAPPMDATRPLAASPGRAAIDPAEDAHARAARFRRAAIERVLGPPVRAAAAAQRLMLPKAQEHGVQPVVPFRPAAYVHASGSLRLPGEHNAPPPADLRGEGVSDHFWARPADGKTAARRVSWAEPARTAPAGARRFAAAALAAGAPNAAQLQSDSDARYAALRDDAPGRRSSRAGRGAKGRVPGGTGIAVTAVHPSRRKAAAPNGHERSLAHTAATEKASKPSKRVDSVAQQLLERFELEA